MIEAKKMCDTCIHKSVCKNLEKAEEFLKLLPSNEIFTTSVSCKDYEHIVFSSPFKPLCNRTDFQ